MPRSRLTSHLKQEDSKKEFSSRLKQNKDLFDRVITILDEKKDQARKTQISNTSYDQPAWSERQADLNGYQRALEEIKSLITI